MDLVKDEAFLVGLRTRPLWLRSSTSSSSLSVYDVAVEILRLWDLVDKLESVAEGVKVIIVEEEAVGVESIVELVWWIGDYSSPLGLFFLWISWEWRLSELNSRELNLSDFSLRGGVGSSTKYLNIIVSRT